MDVVFREGCINFPYTNTLCPSLSFLEEFIYAMNRLNNCFWCVSVDANAKFIYLDFQANWSSTCLGLCKNVTVFVCVVWILNHYLFGKCIIKTVAGLKARKCCSCCLVHFHKKQNYLPKVIFLECYVTFFPLSVKRWTKDSWDKCRK